MPTLHMCLQILEVMLRYTYQSAITFHNVMGMQRMPADIDKALLWKYKSLHKALLL